MCKGKILTINEVQLYGDKCERCITDNRITQVQKDSPSITRIKREDNVGDGRHH